MSDKLSAQELSAQEMMQINGYDAEQRLAYCIKEIVQNRTVWILTDEHGCVMLNSEDEDCVPVWPSEAFAQSWATGEWKECKAEAIPLSKWHSRWTLGLADDELSVVVFPDDNEEGVVLYPDEFDFELKSASDKAAKNYR